MAFTFFCASLARWRCHFHFFSTPLLPECSFYYWVDRCFPMLGGLCFLFTSRARWRGGFHVLHSLCGKNVRFAAGVAHWHSQARRFVFVLLMPGGVPDLSFPCTYANIDLAMLCLINRTYVTALERKRLHLGACDCLNADTCQSVGSPHADLPERCMHKTNLKERSKQFERT